jgi:hypothetical protein
MSNPSVNSQLANITYFRPEQLIFHVKGNLRDDPGAQEKIAGLLAWAREFAEGKGVRLSATGKVFGFDAVDVSVKSEELPPKEGVSYRSPRAETQPPFSMVFMDAINPNWPRSVRDPEKESAEERKTKREVLENLFDLAILLDGKPGAAPGDLEGVTPNWLIGGSPSSPGSTGGPGIQPTPYEGQSPDEDSVFRDLPEIQAQKVDGRSEEPEVNVVVAILDTAPTLEINDEIEDTLLDSIYEKWVTNQPNGNKHFLLESLLGGGKLKKVYLDDDVDQPVPGVWPGGYIQAEDHDYLMTDHGLFVAGIIHSIAPRAEIHLFQVLNRYGVGDLLSITQALQKIRDDDATFPKDRLLVNLSLTIHLPLEKAHGRKGERPDGLGDKIWDQIQKDEKWAKRQVESINRLCGGFYAQGGKVIAAAGNNAEKGKDRPQACFPAALDSVLGVGALPKQKKPQRSSDKVKAASYSNRSDRPASTGIATLGGEAEEKKGDKRGILGIYLGEFPPPSLPRSNGWGWWGGTSFAAPIITGMAAAVRGFIPGLPTMEAAVRELFGAEPYKTEVFNEDVLYATQGSRTP